MALEDKSMGLVVSENAEESLWLDAKKRADTAITQGKVNIEINEQILKLAEEKLKKYAKPSE